MKGIANWIMMAGVIMFGCAMRGWQLDFDLPADPPAWRWVLVAAIVVSVGYRLSQWQEIGEWRMWWQIPKEERPEYYRKLEEARRRRAR